MKKNSKQQQDIKIQNDTNQEIDNWKKRFEIIAEASGQIVYDYCLCDGSIMWSGSIEKVLGYKLSEMNGGIKQREKLIHKDDRSEALRLLEIAKNNSTPYEITYRYKHKDGHYVDFLDRGFFISFPEKNCIRMIGMMQDISSSNRSNQLINGLNSAVMEMQKVFSREDIFIVVARELKKLNIDSMVLLVDDERKNLFFDYYSYDSKLIKVAEKIAGMSVKNLMLSISGSKEYDDVVNNKKTVLVIGSVEFVKQVLPQKVKFMAKQLTKMFKISRFILAPLIIEDRVFGTFSVQADDLLESDIPAVTMFAHQLAGAWNKGDLYNELQKDIKELEHSEKALRLSEERFSKVFRESPYAISISYLNDGRYLDANEKFLKLIGYSRDEVIGKNSIELNLWVDSKNREETARKLQVYGSLKNIQTDFRNKSGDIITWKSSLELVEIGGKECILSMIEDITEQVSSSQALTESEETLRTFINALPEPAFLIDKDYKILISNNSLAEGFNSTPNEISGKNIFEFLPKEDAERRLVHMNKLFEEGKPVVFEDSRDGYYYINYFYPIFDEKREVSKVAVFALDITSRLKAERENVLLAQTLKSVKDAVSITDMDNNLIFVNDAFHEMYGYKENEVIGKHISFIVSDNNPSNSIIKVKEGTVNGNWYGELINKRKDGSEFPIELWTSVVKDINNNDVAMVGVARDITARKQAEKEIEDTNKKLVMAQRVARIGSWEILFPSNERHWSENMYEIMGFPKNIKVNFEELEKRVTPEEFDRFKIALDEAIKTGKPYSMDYRILMSDGTEKYIHDEGEVIRDKDGAIISMFGTTQDITENKLAEIALKESEEKFRTIFENVPLGIFRTKPEGKAISVNPGFAKILGYDSVEDMLDIVNRSNIADVIYADPETRNRMIEITSQSRNWYTIESRFKKKDGKIIAGVLSLHTILNPENQKLEIEGFYTDISFQKQIEDNLKKSEERFKQVAESADEWIWEINTDGLYTYASPVVEKILGYGFEEIVNKKHFYDFFLPDEKDEIKKAAFEAFNKKEKIKGLINRNIHKNGNIVILETNGVPVLDEKNNLIGYRGVDTDITARKQAEEELIKAKEIAEEMNKVKTSFLANMSHEVRTPLVAILGFSEVLSEIVKEEELKNYVDMIHKGGERLLDTLNLILDLSLIEAQKIKIELSPLNIVKEAKEVVALFEKNAERKNLRIETVCDLDSIIIDLDAKILRQILNNLVNNAIKYTTAGGIKVKITEEIKSDKNYIAIRVEDTGIGIPKDKHDLIWEEFRQASEGFNRSFEGAGLGLSITKKFVEKLGGEIFLEKSEVNIGSVFTVLFPCERKIETPSSKKDSNIGIGKVVKPVRKVLPEVLYVEDDPIAIDIVKSFIKDYCIIDSAFSGREGIEKAKNKIYDAILMDINLGKDMDGIEATKIIREIPEYKYIPIIAVTAFAMVGDKDEFFEKGCSHYISKPFTKVELQQLIAEVLQMIK